MKRKKKKSSKSYAFSIGMIIILFLLIRISGVYGSGSFLYAAVLCYLSVAAFPSVVSSEAGRFIYERRHSGNARAAYSFYKCCIGVVFIISTLTAALMMIFRAKLSDLFLFGRDGEKMILLFSIAALLYSYSKAIYVNLAHLMRKASLNLALFLSMLVSVCLFSVLYGIFKKRMEIVSGLLGSREAGELSMAGFCAAAILLTFILAFFYIIISYIHLRKRIEHELSADITRIREPGLVMLVKAGIKSFAALLPALLFLPALFLISKYIGKASEARNWADGISMFFVFFIPSLFFPLNVAIREAAEDENMLYLALVHKESSEARSRLQGMLRVMLPTLFFTAALTASLAEPLMKGICKIDSKVCMICVSISAIAIPFAVLGIFAVHLLLALRRRGTAAIILYSAFVPALILMFVFKKVGFDLTISALIVTTLASVVMCLTGLPLLFKTFNAGFPSLKFLKTFLSAVVSGLIMFLISFALGMIPLHPAIIFVLSFFIGGFIYLILLFLTRTMNSNDAAEQPLSQAVVFIGKSFGFIKKKKRRRV